MVAKPFLAVASLVFASFREKIDRQPTRLAEQVLFWKGEKIASKKFGEVTADVGVWFSFGEKTLGIKPSRDVYIKVELLRFGW